MLKYLFPITISMLVVGGLVTFILAGNAEEFRNFGPVLFNFHAFTYLGLLMGFSILLVLFYNYKDMQLGFELFLLFTSFLFKIGIIYFVFNGHVNYDAPLHYLSALYIKDYGINPEIYSYHNWPSALVLIDTLSVITNSRYPFDTALIAFTSRFILPLTLYLLSSRLFNNRKLISLALIVLLIFEPFILHFCPQIVAVAIYVLLIYIVAVKVLTNSQSRGLFSSIVVPLILYISLLTYHAIFPISLALVVASYYIAYKVSSKFSINSYYNKSHGYNPLLYILIVTLLGVLFYNTLITALVTKSVSKTIEAIFTLEGNLRLDVYGPSIQSPDLVWQYSMLRIISRVSIVTLLLVPTIYMFYHIFYIIYTKDDKSYQEHIIFIVFTIGVNAFLYLVSFILQTGLMERSLQLVIIFTAISLPYSVQKFLASPKLHKTKRTIMNGVYLYLIFFSILSIYVAPAYQQVHWFFDDEEVFMAKWIAVNIDSYTRYLDGADRLNQLIVLYTYPNKLYKVNIFITSYTDDAAVENADPYPQGTIITVTGLAYIKNSFKYSLSDVLLKQYYDELRYRTNMVYFDGIDTCLVR